MIYRVTDEAQKISYKEVTEFWRGRKCLISRSNLKNRQVFTATRFSSLEKQITVFH